MSKEKCAFRVKKFKSWYIFVVVLNSEEEEKKEEGEMVEQSFGQLFRCLVSPFIHDCVRRFLNQ